MDTVREDEVTTIEIPYKSEKNITTSSTNISTTTTTSFATSSTTVSTATAATAGTTTTTTTISIPSVFNITNGGEASPYNATAATATASAVAANDASGRSAALERAYVHDVYENCEEPSGPIRPRVAQFLAGLEPGSIVCDVGCGNGRYLTSCNPLICTIGVDRCYRLTKVAKEKGGEVALCDNLELPFRDESFDAVLSLAVVHHFATTERRVGAIRELARILRIGGRVVISVWALEQRHRRFESQDVLIPWQPPKNRNYNYSDEEDDDDYLPPYHAYTEDSTNSSRSAGDGDSSSLSSSSPGESCYSFVRRAIQKLAGGRKHPWFLDSWNSKETKNDSSLEYEDAKDLPIELRRLEDFEDFPDPPLSAGLKSRSLGSILNPPPRQIVRSRSSVPSLGAQMPEQKPSTSLQSATTAAATVQQSPQKSYAISSGSSTSAGQGNSSVSQASSTTVALQQDSSISVTTSTTMSPTAQATTVSSGRRPKLVKQKQSLCDDEYQLPDNPFHTIGNSNSSSNSNSCCNTKNITNINAKSHESKLFLRKQSSLNEELMAESRLREKERVRKRIQKQMSLNEAFLCRSLFSKRLQIIREGFTTKLKTSTGSLERVTKNGFVKIMQNFKASQFSAAQNNSTTSKDHTNDSSQQNSNIVNNQSKSSTCTVGGSTGNHCNNSCNNNNCNNVNNGNEDQKPRRHSRESGSDSSKDSSLQSDTSIESEDSFASVIYIPRPEQQGNHQQPQNSNNNNNSSNSICNNGSNIINSKNNNSHKIPSVPTSPLIMPCPPTPAHSPAAITTVPNNSTTITQTSMLSPPRMFSNTSHTLQGNNRALITNRFTFDEEHINQQQEQQQQNLHQQQVKKNSATADAIIGNTQTRQTQQHKSPKITRQTIKDLPPIPKFRKQQSLQSASKGSFPIVRRASAAPSVPKLMSLELFNPETDDLDSDSSEPSSPDSIDSVISALKPGTDEELNQQQQNPKEIGDLIGSLKTSPQPQATNNELSNNGDHFSLDMSKASKLQKHRDNQQQYSFDIKMLKNNHESKSGEKRSASVGETKSTEIYGTNATVATEQNYGDTNTGEYLLLNKTDELQNFNSDNLFYNSNNTCRQDLVEFAEQLSAQLLKELEEKNKLEKNAERVDSIDEDDDIRNSFNSAIDDPFVKKRNGECRDLTSLREELRERRLLLANLTTHHSQQQSPTLTSSSTSSLSSQTRSFTIHEEDDEVDDVEPSIFDSKKFKTKYLRTFNNSDYRQPYNVVPDTAYLIQEDGDSSVKDDEDDEIEHDVIIEEDEDQDEENEYNVCEMNEYGKRTSSNTITCMEDSSSPKRQIQLETRPSTESWGHSNSTTSLDSPSQGGGSTTHHRYYHVFREGELDALINHHVASLHIVSSYYERASWCVVAEKVQVWTI